MIYHETDPFNDADRYDLLLNEKDAAALGIKEGDPVVAFNQYGTFHGRAKFVEIKTGNVEVHWPEGNALIPKGVYEKYAGIPEYNTAVILEKAETYFAHKDTKYAEKRVEELEMD